MNKIHLLNFSKYLLTIVPKYIKKVTVYQDELSISVSKKYLVLMIFFLKNHFNTQFSQLIDICGVDYLSKKKRFKVNYNLLSLTYNYRIRITVDTDEYNPIPSLTKMFNSTLWLEREVWDTYGIFFSNHPDLRRLLTDYGFEGYPFRKDFPQIGFFEVRYDDEKKHVLYEPVELAQEFRLFNFSSPWVQVK